MAVNAVRDQPMLLLMAERAGLLTVYRLGCGQQSVLFFMTCGTEIRGSIYGIGNDLGHVRLVADLAVIRFDVCRMRCMALDALGHLAVSIMTVGTVLGRMLAPVFEQLLDLRRMADEAGFGHRCPEHDLERRVRVQVTYQTIFFLVMPLALVALAARRDVVLRCGTMAGMAILAGYRGLVFGGIHLNVCGLRFMAFNTVA